MRDFEAELLAQYDWEATRIKYLQRLKDEGRVPLDGDGSNVDLDGMIEDVKKIKIEKELDNYIKSLEIEALESAANAATLAASSTILNGIWSRK
jgi:hypothetical protein